MDLDIDSLPIRVFVTRHYLADTTTNDALAERANTLVKRRFSGDSDESTQQ